MKFQLKLMLAGVVIFLGMLFQLPHLTEFPVGHHAWTQTDHYALSIRFQENGFDFFHPQTYIYNQEIDEGVKIPTGSTITAVDFPIHQYIISLIMHASGVSSVAVFRIYTLIYSFIGLYFLGLLVFLLCRNFESVLLIVTLAATTPLFVYFQSSMMPSIPSWANAVIGIYFWVFYQHTHKKPHYFIAIAFLTLAALSRMTFAIPLLALMSFECSQFIWKKSIYRYKIFGLLTAVIVFMTYYSYNFVLREKYGSNFLSSFLPAKSFDQAQEWFALIIESWTLHYFSIFHYAAIIGILIVATWALVLAKARLKAVHSRIVIFLLIYFAGCLLFLVLMLQQFISHDYYYLDTFYLPIWLLLTIALSLVRAPRNKYFTWILRIAIFVLLIPIGIGAMQSNRNLQHNEWWNRTAATHHNFLGSDHFLDILGIPQNADILVLDAYAPNLPFVHMRRTGHSLINTKGEYIENAMKWNWDYAVIQNEFFYSDVYQNYPEITRLLDFTGSNGRISIYKRAESNEKQNLHDFLGLDQRSEILNRPFPAEQNGSGWNIPVLQEDTMYSSNDEFPLSFTYPIDSLPLDKNLEIFVNISGEIPSGSQLELVVSLSSADSTKFYRSHSQYYTEQNQDFEHGLLFLLPDVSGSENKLSVYLWNPNRVQIQVRTGRVQIFSTEKSGV